MSNIKFSKTQTDNYSFNVYCGVKTITGFVRKRSKDWFAIIPSYGFVGIGTTRKAATSEAIAVYNRFIQAIADQDVATLASFLHFSLGNGKLANDTLIWSLPAGKTCPGANLCLSIAKYDANGDRSVVDGNETEFRCFAASSEAQYDQTFAARQRNLAVIKACLAISRKFALKVMITAIYAVIKDSTVKFRIHESGDYFSEEYRELIFEVLRFMPDLKGYSYSKNLPLFLDVEMPSNFYLTASHGGRFDHLIDQGLFKRYAKVFMTEADAIAAGLPVDVDDKHCFLDGAFAILIHGTQPKGTSAAKMAFKHSRERKALKAKYALA